MPLTPDPKAHAEAPTKVFLVHGHDNIGRNEVVTLLNGLDVEPVVLTEIPGPEQSLFQKILKYAKVSGFAIVILSADDRGASRRRYDTATDRESTLRFRARQNVILELGFFYGSLGWDKVFVVHRKPDDQSLDFERPSDLDGVVYDTIDETGAWRESLVERMRSAGLPIPRVVVVDRNSNGYRSINQAVRNAQPDTRILVNKGKYTESVVIDRPVEIVGLGDRADVIVESTSHDVFSFQAANGRLANLTIRYVGDSRSAVNITRGRLVLEDCDIACKGLSCVSILQSAEPLVRRNRIHQGRQEGVHAKENARGVIEFNTIFEHGLAGVAIHENAAPDVRDNEIYDCEQGVYIGFGGQEPLVIHGNSIHDNRRDAIENPGGRKYTGDNVQHANNRRA